mgnify:FL=1|jgi:hypothetical protein|tara:strand:+ start:260 stop:931 length:672 start_codon:yes stop_codon:yes gene_type:complete
MGEPASDSGSGFISDKKSRAEAKARRTKQEIKNTSLVRAGPHRDVYSSSSYGKGITPRTKTVEQSRFDVAERDLERRATQGQISQRNIDNLGLGRINEFGKSRARDIQNKIKAGGTRVYDERGRIQGVVHTSNTLFGPQQVYTGSGSYAPKDLGNFGKRGRQSQTISPNEIGGGSDGESNVPVMKNTTGSTLSSTKMNNAAIKQARVASLGAGGGGANRRKFV